MLRFLHRFETNLSNSLQMKPHRSFCFARWSKAPTGPRPRHVRWWSELGASPGCSSLLRSSTSGASLTPISTGPVGSCHMKSENGRGRECPLPSMQIITFPSMPFPFHWGAQCENCKMIPLVGGPDVQTAFGWEQECAVEPPLFYDVLLGSSKHQASRQEYVRLVGPDSSIHNPTSVMATHRSPGSSSSKIHTAVGVHQGTHDLVKLAFSFGTSSNDQKFLVGSFSINSA